MSGGQFLPEPCRDLAFDCCAACSAEWGDGHWSEGDQYDTRHDCIGAHVDREAKAALRRPAVREAVEVKAMEVRRAAIAECVAEAERVVAELAPKRGGSSRDRLLRRMGASMVLAVLKKLEALEKS